MNVVERRSSHRAPEQIGGGASSVVLANKPVASVTAVLPFYNEKPFIEATLQSLANQDIRPEKLLLVDNGSTDESVALCRAFAANTPDTDVTIITAITPGKIHALQAASPHITTKYVAFCDADTRYPRHYFRKAIELFCKGSSSVVGALAVGTAYPADGPASSAHRKKTALVGRLLAKQCHSGGFGQVFRSDAYWRAGGYDPSFWPYVLEDHEILHRILSLGAVVYDADFWCEPSDRRSDRSDVSWSLKDRILYHLTPYRLKNWYFYKYLGPRLQFRKMTNDALRRQPWAA